MGTTKKDVAEYVSRKKKLAATRHCRHSISDWQFQIAFVSKIEFLRFFGFLFIFFFLMVKIEISDQATQLFIQKEFFIWVSNLHVIFHTEGIVFIARPKTRTQNCTIVYDDYYKLTLTLIVSMKHHWLSIISLTWGLSVDFSLQTKDIRYHFNLMDVYERIRHLT